MKSYRWLRYPLAAALVLVVALVYAGAPAGRYAAGSGTVTDTKTGLVWQQPDDGLTYTWANAKSHCASLGSGWRLPTMKELPTLVDYGKTTAPRIDSTFSGTGSTAYWSSSPFANSPGGVWGVEFIDGGTTSDVATSANRVRCVR